MEGEEPIPAGFIGEAFRGDGFIIGFGGWIMGMEDDGKGGLKGPPGGRVDNQSL